MFDSFKKIMSLFTTRERKQFYWILFGMILLALLDVVGVAAIIPFTAVVADPEIIQHHAKLHAVYQALHFTHPRQFLLFLGVVVLSILIIGNSYGMIMTWIIARFSALHEYHLSKRLLTRYLTQPYTFFLNQNTSVLSSHVLTEISIVIHQSVMPMMELIAKSLITMLILALLCWVNLLLAITAIVFLGGSYALIFLFSKKKLSEASRAIVKNHQLRYQIIAETFGGIKDIKLSHREHFFLDAFSIPTRDNAHYVTVSRTAALMPRYALEVIAFGGILLIIIYYLLAQITSANIIPILALYGFACLRLMPALQAIFAGMTSMKVCKGALDVIHEDLYHTKNVADVNVIKPIQQQDHIRFERELKLSQISFAYDESKKPVLKNIHFSISAKTTVGMVGVTGAGKTTAVDLILGLLHPQSGNVFVDDVKLNEHNLRAWQNKLGYVPQHIYLADDSITNNIAFGIPSHEINHAAVERAAKIANIHDFIITELPHQYETFIGERGVRLSGGQRQRIGIARALYNDPDVLILDEATSSLDSVTENAVMDAVHALSSKKTMIIIAHRLTTVKECDTILLFEDGKIINSGTYADLFESDELFKKLVNMS